jgi:MFS family permease
MLSPTGIKDTPNGKLTEKEKKTLIRTLLFSLVCCGTVYLNVMSFFPLFVKDKYGEDTISATMISVCMSAFEFAGIVTSPINASMISKIGRKTSLIIGFILIALSTFSLGALSYIDTTEWKTFYYASMATRFV